MAAHRSSCQITYKKIGGWMCEVVSGMFLLGGWWGMFSLGGWWGVDWRKKKVTLQNCGRAIVKPKTQPGGAVLAP